MKNELLPAPEEPPAATGPAEDPHWYKDAVIYELHIKAFADSTGDGIGDFRGLIDKLDHVRDLGVNTIWLLPFYPSPLRDDGYDVADFTSVNPAYGTAGAVLQGTATVNAVGGVATFTGLSLNTAGTGYVLTASSGSIMNADSAPFNITSVGPAAKVVFQRSPAGAAPGTPFTAQPIVVVQDAAGNTVTSFSGRINVGLERWSGTGGAVLTGTASLLAANGVATFTNLAIDRAGSNYVLWAASTGLAASDSTPFNVVPTGQGTAVRLAFQQQPVGGAVGVPFPVQPVVVALDGGGNVAQTFSGRVSVGIERWSGTSGAVLSGTATVTAVNGIATFTNLAIDRVGTNYVLWTAASGVAAADSAPLQVGL